MLFPKENQPSTNPQASAQQPAAPPPQSAPIVIQQPPSGVKIPILFGAVLALVGASGYLYYQIGQLREDLAQTRDALSTEISKMNETSTVSTQTNRRNMDSMKKEVDHYRAQAAQLTGEAKTAAIQHADEVAAKLQRMQEEQGKQVAAVSSEVSAVKTEATAANAKIGEVSTEVGSVKSDVAKTRTELEKTIADLKSTRGDLGVQSGLIATNGKELAALKALGERNYSDFKITKTKTPQKVGDLLILLKSADPKKNKYTVEVTADDKKVEKKDKNINEPVQFLLSRATQPYELVVNDIKKDFISGYVSAPKVQTTRN
jgi:chromosome segregation ATPase